MFKNSHFIYYNNQSFKKEFIVYLNDGNLETNGTVII